MALCFRFTDPDDVAAYGPDWRVWDQGRLAALRARELIALEAALGMAIPMVVKAFAEQSVLGRMAVMWLTLRLDGDQVAWAGFDPLTFSVEWSDGVPPDPLGSSGEDPAPGSGSSPAQPPNTESATS